MVYTVGARRVLHELVIYLWPRTIYVARVVFNVSSTAGKPLRWRLPQSRPYIREDYVLVFAFYFGLTLFYGVPGSQTFHVDPPFSTGKDIGVESVQHSCIPHVVVNRNICLFAWCRCWCVLFFSHVFFCAYVVCNCNSLRGIVFFTCWPTHRSYPFVIGRFLSFRCCILLFCRPHPLRGGGGISFSLYVYCGPYDLNLMYVLYVCMVTPHIEITAAGQKLVSMV